MTREELDTLKKQAKSALLHAELVELARNKDLTPNQVKNEAVRLGWPERPAKAARSLAILRRDHGMEALEAFIAQTEHARSERSDTEHARENKRMNDRIRDAITHLPDTASKLALMIKHGLTEDVSALVMRLIESGPADFHSDLREQRVFFDTLQGVERPEGSFDRKDEQQTASLKRHEERIALVVSNNPGAERPTGVNLDFEGLATFLNWNEEQKLAMIRKITMQLIASGPPKPTRSLRPIAQLCRTYFDAKDEFAVQTELWLLRCHLHEGRTFELRRRALPVPIHTAAEDELQELDPIVDRFLELGWTNEQVCDELLRLLGDNLKDMQPQFALALCGAKCFDQCKEAQARRKQMLREHYLTPFWNRYIRGDYDKTALWSLKYFKKLGRLGLWEREYKDYRTHEPIQNDREFFRIELTKMLAVGRLATVYQLLVLFGSSWGLFYAERSENSRAEKASEYLDTLVPEAFDQAYNLKTFGIAAALVQHFGKDKFLSSKVLNDFAYQAEQAVQEDWVNYELQHAELIEQESDAEDSEEEGVLDRFYEGDGKVLVECKEALEAKERAKFEELKAAREKALATALQLAVDLEQPIQLEHTVYLQL